MTCRRCKAYFEKFSCGAWCGECDCPKCQGTCECVPMHDPDEVMTVISDRGIERGFLRGNTIHVVKEEL
jgi:hypothetical protein